MKGTIQDYPFWCFPRNAKGQGGLLLEEIFYPLTSRTHHTNRKNRISQLTTSAAPSPAAAIIAPARARPPPATPRSRPPPSRPLTRQPASPFSSSLLPATRNALAPARRRAAPHPSAAAYNICNVIPPYPHPYRRFVFAHLNRSLVTSSDGPDPLGRLVSSTFAENNGSLLESSSNDEEEEEEEGADEALPHAAAARSSGTLSPAHFESAHHWSGAKSQGYYRCGKGGGFWGHGDKEAESGEIEVDLAEIEADLPSVVWPCFRSRRPTVDVSSESSHNLVLSGMTESKEFAMELFDTLSQRRQMQVDKINKEELREIWQQITDNSFDSRLQIFFDMVNKNADGQVKEAVRELTKPMPNGSPLTIGELLKNYVQEGVHAIMLLWDDKTSHDKFLLKMVCELLTKGSTEAKPHG